MSEEPLTLVEKSSIQLYGLLVVVEVSMQNVTTVCVMEKFADEGINTGDFEMII